MLTKWAFDQKFGFSMTEYQLRKSFLKIIFLTEGERETGQILINLFLISTGPYHQDYAVKMKKGENTRVSFDMKIAQVIEIKLDSIYAEVKLATKHPGEKFNYSIKTIVQCCHNAGGLQYPPQRELEQLQRAGDDRRQAGKRVHPVTGAVGEHNEAAEDVEGEEPGQMHQGQSQPGVEERR